MPKKETILDVQNTKIALPLMLIVGALIAAGSSFFVAKAKDAVEPDSIKNKVEMVSAKASKNKDRIIVLETQQIQTGKDIADIKESIKNINDKASRTQEDIAKIKALLEYLTKKSSK